MIPSVPIDVELPNLIGIEKASGEIFVFRFDHSEEARANLRAIVDEMTKNPELNFTDFEAIVVKTHADIIEGAGPGFFSCNVSIPSEK